MTPRSTFEVLWTEVALADLEDVVGFIEKEDPGAASAVLDRLEQTAQNSSSILTVGESCLSWPASSFDSIGS